MFAVDEIQRLLEQGLPDAKIEVIGDGHHFEAVIVSAAFVGKSKLQRHQLVYGVLGKRVGNEIHALSLKTLAPDEAGQ
jgi:acid stress-induced BolA-like protein IbaG/YrbA